MRTTAGVVGASAAALLLALTACSSDSSDDKPASSAKTSSAKTSSAKTSSAETSSAEKSHPTSPSKDDMAEAPKSAGIPDKPTGAKRQALLAAIRDVNAKLTADEDKAVDAARNQCSALDGGATNPDHTAAQRFSYDGITLTDDDGAHLNFGLRKTLCPKT